ncbi:MAG: glycosyltransferase family 39 protein [Dehalococcoidales bacterium]
MKNLNFRTITLLCLLAVCSLWVGMWIIRVVQNIGQPQIEYSEGFNIYIAHLFATGKWSWQIASTPPFSTSFYPPVGFYVLGYFQRVFGESLVSGRILNLMYTLGCLLMIFLIVKHETKDKLVSLIAALLPMTAITMIAWSFFIRVDLLGIFFDLAGVYLFLRNKDNLKMLWAIPVFVLAFYTKQSMVAGVITCIVYLLIHKEWRRTLFFGGAFAVIAGGIFLTAVILTHGGYLREIYLYQRTVPACQSAAVILANVLIAIVLYVPATIMAAAWWTGQKKWEVLRIFIIFTLIVNISNLVHPGGNFNYLFESIFVICILAGMYLNYADIEKDFRAAMTSMIFMFVAFMLAAIGLMGEAFPTAQYRANVAQAVSILKGADYPILTENAGMVLAAGDVPYYEPFVFTNLNALGYWSETKLLSDLDTKKVPYVVTEYPLPNPGVKRIDTATQNAIVANYHVILESGINRDSGKGTSETGIYAEYSFVLWKAN